MASPAFFRQRQVLTGRIAQLSLTLTHLASRRRKPGRGNISPTQHRQGSRVGAETGRDGRESPSSSRPTPRHGNDGALGGVPPRTLTPRLLLVHSLSHALIRQLSLSCGYGSASLRERPLRRFRRLGHGGLACLHLISRCGRNTRWAGSPSRGRKLGSLVRGLPVSYGMVLF